jgi:hypothetical protein
LTPDSQPVALDVPPASRMLVSWGCGTVLVNEVHTMPGFTPISMFARAWAATSVGYPELVDRLIASALRGAGR